jgi:predicted HAD superfamily Cof-like phosphohydrolase
MTQVSEQNQMMTNFEKVCEFNTAFDVTKYEVNQINNIFNSPNDSQIKMFNLRCDLVIEEANELQEAYNNNDMIEVRDAISDILYVLYGIGYTYNFNMNGVEDSNIYTNDNELNPSFIVNKSLMLKNINNFDTYKTEVLKLTKTVYDYAKYLNIDVNSDFSIVHSSNMSKICNDEDTAIQTVESYMKKYIEDPEKTPYDTPYYYKIQLNNVDKYVIKNKSTGKVLKSIKYHEVKFD